LAARGTVDSNVAMNVLLPVVPGVVFTTFEIQTASRQGQAQALEQAEERFGSQPRIDLAKW